MSKIDCAFCCQQTGKCMSILWLMRHTFSGGHLRVICMNLELYCEKSTTNCNIFLRLGFLKMSCFRYRILVGLYYFPTTLEHKRRLMEIFQEVQTIGLYLLHPAYFKFIFCSNKVVPLSNWPQHGRSCFGSSCVSTHALCQDTLLKKNIIETSWFNALVYCISCFVSNVCCTEFLSILYDGLGSHVLPILHQHSFTPSPMVYSHYKLLRSSKPKTKSIVSDCFVQQILFTIFFFRELLLNTYSMGWIIASYNIYSSKWICCKIYATNQIRQCREVYAVRDRTYLK